jgi:hypothetical protein
MFIKCISLLLKILNQNHNDLVLKVVGQIIDEVYKLSELNSEQ